MLFLIEFAALIFIDIPCGLNNIKKAKVKPSHFKGIKGKIYKTSGENSLQGEARLFY